MVVDHQKEEEYKIIFEPRRGTYLVLCGKTRGKDVSPSYRDDVSPLEHINKI